MKKNRISEMIGLNEWLMLKIRGDCMRPIFSSGDRIHATKKRFYLPGDILVFHGSGQTITSHRFLGYVITPRGLKLMTKADNRNRPDGLVEIQNIIGKITQIVQHPEPFRISPRKRLQAVCEWLTFTSEIFLRQLFLSGK